MPSTGKEGLRRSPAIIVGDDQIVEVSAQELILCGLSQFPPTLELRIIRQFELERDVDLILGLVTIEGTPYTAHLYKGKVNTLYIKERP